MKIIQGIIIGLSILTLQACSVSHKDPLSYLPATALSLIQIDAQKKAGNDNEVPSINNDSPLFQSMNRLKSKETNSDNSDIETKDSIVVENFSESDLNIEKINQVFAALHKKSPYITKSIKDKNSYIPPLFPTKNYKKIDIENSDKEFFVLLVNTNKLSQEKVQKKITSYFHKNWQIDHIRYAPLEYNDDEEYTNTALTSLSHTMSYTSYFRTLDSNIKYKFDTGLELKSIAIHLVRPYQGGNNAS